MMSYLGQANIEFRHNVFFRICLMRSTANRCDFGSFNFSLCRERTCKEVLNFEIKTFEQQVGSSQTQAVVFPSLKEFSRFSLEVHFVLLLHLVDPQMK